MNIKTLEINGMLGEVDSRISNQSLMTMMKASDSLLIEYPPASCRQTEREYKKIVLSVYTNRAAYEIMN